MKLQLPPLGGGDQAFSIRDRSPTALNGEGRESGLGLRSRGGGIINFRIYNTTESHLGIDLPVRWGGKRRGGKKRRKEDGGRQAFRSELAISISPAQDDTASKSLSCSTSSSLRLLPVMILSQAAKSALSALDLGCGQNRRSEELGFSGNPTPPKVYMLFLLVNPDPTRPTAMSKNAQPFT